jgi:hypothetical protein
MSWVSVSVGDSNKGNTNKVFITNEYVSLPFPCSDSTDCTYYSVTLELGTYDLEVWGAQGGNDTHFPTSVFGGRGGYSKGTVQLNSKTTLFVYVGGSGTGSTSGVHWGCTGGGGGTDFRLQNGMWNDTNGLKTRIIVAGGGGGGMGQNYSGAAYLGNDGGGTTAPTFTGSGYTVTGATQTSGGSSSTTGASVAVGSFGYANPNIYGNTNSKGGYNGGARGSGGGWWGGCTSPRTGSGGSGFVYTTSNSQCSASSDYYLYNASTFSGNTNFLSPYGGFEVGHRGNGFARITNINSRSSSNYLSRLCNHYCSNNANRRRNEYIPLISLFIFALYEGEIPFKLLPNLKLNRKDFCE